MTALEKLKQKTGESQNEFYARMTSTFHEVMKAMPIIACPQPPVIQRQLKRRKWKLQETEQRI